MIPWTAFERRWLRALLAAMIPRLSPEGLPGHVELAADRAITELLEAAPPLLALGLRASVWLLTWSPALLAGRFARFGALSEDERDTLLARAGHSRSYVLRQLVVVLKLAACFTYFTDRGVRDVFAREEVR